MTTTTTTTKTNYNSLFQLSNKTAVVTGGTGLLGTEVSTALAQAGARVLIADISAESGQRLAEILTGQGLNATFIPFNLTDFEHLEINLLNLFEQQGAIDIWINTAYPRSKDWGIKNDSLPLEFWRQNVELQMSSYCLSTKYVAELMRKKGIAGSIINFGSIYGLVGGDPQIYEGTAVTFSANYEVYSAIKGGIVNFSRQLAATYGRHNIRINCLCPGGIFNFQDDRFVQNFSRKVPLKRMGKPTEIAAAALFLASEAASYITGSAVIVDGGWTCI